jgi:cytochrome P450
MAHRHEVERVLADPRFQVPGAAAGETGLAWLRSMVSRFANGPEHGRRRALIDAELRGLDPARLREDARRRTEAVLHAAGGRVELMGCVARAVPLAALGHALGIPPAALDGAVADAMLLAPAYLPASADPAVDAAVERLRRLLDRGSPERSAAAVAVLAQACEATAGLIGNAVVLAGEGAEVGEMADPGVLPGRVDALLGETVRGAAPIRALRRVSPQGDPVTLDLEAAAADSGPGDPPLTFGAGFRRCPGEAEAMALAAGVLEGVLLGWRAAEVVWADTPGLRMPLRLEVARR